MRSFAFPRQRRLTRSDDYRRVFAGSCRVAGQQLLLLGRRNRDNTPRLGLAIAKKYLKRAVDRNRTKRTIRESFRRHQHLLKGIDVIVLVRCVMKSGNAQTLARDLDEMWSRLNNKCLK